MNFSACCHSTPSPFEAIHKLDPVVSVYCWCGVWWCLQCVKACFFFCPCTQNLLACFASPAVVVRGGLAKSSFLESLESSCTVCFHWTTDLLALLTHSFLFFYFLLEHTHTHSLHTACYSSSSSRVAQQLLTTHHH